MKTIIVKSTTTSPCIRSSARPTRLGVAPSARTLPTQLGRCPLSSDVAHSARTLPTQLGRCPLTFRVGNPPTQRATLTGRGSGRRALQLEGAPPPTSTTKPQGHKND